MSVPIFIAALFTGVVRGVMFCSLFVRELSPKYSNRKTWALFMAGELAIDVSHELVGNAYDNIMVWFVLYYIIFIPAMILLLFQGSVLTRLGRGGLCLLTIFCGSLPVSVTLPLFPERVRYVVSHTYYFVNEFSLNYFIVLFWMVYSCLLQLVFALGVFKVFGIFKNRSQLPRTPRFMLIPLTQAAAPGMLSVLYYVPDAFIEKEAFPFYVFGMAFFCIICDTLLFVLVRRMDMQALQSRRLQLMEQEQQAFYKRYSAINSLYRRERIFHHDINNQLATADALYASGNKDKALELLDSVSSMVSHFSAGEGV